MRSSPSIVPADRSGLCGSIRAKAGQWTPPPMSLMRWRSGRLITTSISRQRCRTLSPPTPPPASTCRSRCRYWVPRDARTAANFWRIDLIELLPNLRFLIFRIVNFYPPVVSNDLPEERHSCCRYAFQNERAWRRSLSRAGSSERRRRRSGPPDHGHHRAVRWRP